MRIGLTSRFIRLGSVRPWTRIDRQDRDKKTVPLFFKDLLPTRTERKKGQRENDSIFSFFFLSFKERFPFFFFFLVFSIV